MNKTAKAFVQLIVATLVFVVVTMGVVGMYVSTDFLPVYDGAGHWHIVFQLLRYCLYAIHGVTASYAVYAMYEAGKYLVRRIKRRLRYYL